MRDNHIGHCNRISKFLFDNTIIKHIEGRVFARIPVVTLWKEYKKWCVSNNQPHIGCTNFIEILTELGFRIDVLDQDFLVADYFSYESLKLKIPAKGFA